MPMYVANVKVTNLMRFYIEADTEEEAEELACEADLDSGDLIRTTDFEIDELRLMTKDKK